MTIFPSTPKRPFGNHSRNCLACGRDAGLKQCYSEGDIMCGHCWLRVEHLVDKPRQAFDACRLFRAGHAESMSALDNDLLVALGKIEEWV